MKLDRRDWLTQMAAIGAAVPALTHDAAARARAGQARAAQAPAAQASGVPVPSVGTDLPATDHTLKFFPGFKSFRVKTTGAEIHGVIGGSGPPVLLLHGAPQSHVTWRLVAPKLAATHTVIAADIRGYGDSSKPPDGDNHVNYSKRAMALDMVEVMRHFTFEKFPVIGQDRGGRVAHRMVLDHPDRVTRAAVLDIVPTYYLYTHVDIRFVQAYFHWFSYLRRPPVPENELKASNDAALARATSDVQREYLRTMTDPATIHAMCEDYRAGASIELQHDAADLNQTITCPLRVLWAEKGAMGRLYDVMAIWKERGTSVTGRALPGGHNLQEDVPDMVLDEITSLIA